MESVRLDTPDGIEALLAWDPKVTEHDRKRILARRLVAQHLGVEEQQVRIDREAPAQFGFHTQLFAVVDDEEVPLLIKNANFRAASVVALAAAGTRLGLDLRDSHPDEHELSEMHQHSRLFEDASLQTRIAHWTRVQAVREADGRGTRVKAEHVRLDSPLRRGWIPDRKEQYELFDLSRDGWVVTIAYHDPR